MKKRVFHYTIILVVVIIINFFIPRLLPGTPLKSIVGENPGDLTAAEKMGILEAYHLNEPMYKQFGYYLKELFTLNWGNSYAKRQPISELIRSRLGWTLLLAGCSTLLSTIIGTCLGAVSALRRKKRKDVPVVLATTVVSSIPSFWIAIILLAVFGVKLRWFPIYGAYDMWESYTGLARAADILKHLALPLFTLVISSLMAFFSTSRYSTLRVMEEDYVKMARLRGITGSRVTFCYVFRNALIPVFTLFMMDVGYMLGGSVLVETVFSYPGLGTLMKEAVMARDYPLMQYTFLMSSVVTIAALFLSDILYHRIDPRVEVNGNE
ncbi:MAG: ABC transporter permease [Lachnospiraceae bacterium]|nr:ABC transporter permease [Lachnospiraceae bacterium]